MSEIREVWKDVVGYEGLYEVSDHGRVRSVDRFVQTKTGPQKHKGQSLTFWYGSLPYPSVTFSRPGAKPKAKAVHSAVAEAFIGPKPTGTEVRHLDGDPKNPKVGNLEYGTKLQNYIDSVSHGTARPPRGKKLNIEDVVAIRAMRAAGSSRKAIAVVYGIRQDHAYEVYSGRKWRDV